MTRSIDKMTKIKTGKHKREKILHPCFVTYTKRSLMKSSDLCHYFIATTYTVHMFINLSGFYSHEHFTSTYAAGIFMKGNRLEIFKNTSMCSHMTRYFFFTLIKCETHLFFCTKSKCVVNCEILKKVHTHFRLLYPHYKLRKINQDVLQHNM